VIKQNIFWQIRGTKLRLPQGLCEHEEIFHEVLSMETWQNLSDANKKHLKVSTFWYDFFIAPLDVNRPWPKLTKHVTYCYLS